MDMLLRAHCEKGEFERALETAERARAAFKAVGDEAALLCLLAHIFP